jgi:PilZ domain
MRTKASGALRRDSFGSGNHSHSYRRGDFDLQYCAVMSTQGTYATAARIDRRRSTRLPVRLEVIICGDEGRFQEQTRTSSLNIHGVLVALAAQVAIGDRLTIQNPENWAERSGHVIRLGRCYAGRTEVGIEFMEPAPDFWLLNDGHERGSG